eukprot:c4487_g1_i1.p1 GENE.c4487_g1_i1~~c4487_g1_i1.p1  ORF type:complete len:379 (+),score=82.83 c4487_g1_i1:36-1172(+)
MLGNRGFSLLAKVDDEERDDFSVVHPIEFVSLFLLALSGGLLPIFFLRRSLAASVAQALHSHNGTVWWHAIMTCAMVFSGGVLLGVAFLHLLPEARAYLKESHETSPNNSSEHRHDSISAADVLCLSTLVVLFILAHGCSALISGPEGHEVRCSVATSFHAIITKANRAESVSEYKPPVIRPSLTLSNDHIYEAPKLSIPTQSTLDPTLARKVPTNFQDVQNLSQGTSMNLVNIFNVVFLWVLLVVHSFLEGISLGMPDHLDGQIGLFVVVASHKAFEAFALGSCLTKAPLQPSTKGVMLFLFALSCPLGGIVGAYAISESSRHSKGVAQALSAGTFIYVGLLEIVCEEFSKKCSGRLLAAKSLSLLVGCIVIGVLQV